MGNADLSPGSRCGKELGAHLEPCDAQAATSKPQPSLENGLEKGIGMGWDPRQPPKRPSGRTGTGSTLPGAISRWATEGGWNEPHLQLAELGIIVGKSAAHMLSSIIISLVCQARPAPSTSAHLIMIMVANFVWCISGIWAPTCSEYANAADLLLGAGGQAGRGGNLNKETPQRSAGAAPMPAPRMEHPWGGRDWESSALKASVPNFPAFPSGPTSLQERPCAARGGNGLLKGWGRAAEVGSRLPCQGGFAMLPDNWTGSRTDRDPDGCGDGCHEDLVTDK